MAIKDRVYSVIWGAPPRRSAVPSPARHPHRPSHQSVPGSSPPPRRPPRPIASPPSTSPSPSPPPHHSPQASVGSPSPPPSPSLPRSSSPSPSRLRSSSSRRSSETVPVDNPEMMVPVAREVMKDIPRFMRSKTIGLIIAGIAAGAKDAVKERIKELLASWRKKRKQRDPNKEEDDEDQLPPASLPTCSSNVNYPPWYLSVPPVSSKPEEENVAMLFPSISTLEQEDLDNPHCTVLSNPTSDDHIAAGHEHEDSFLLVHKNNAFSVEDQELASGDEHQELAYGEDKYQLDSGDKPQELVDETNAAYSVEETPEPPFQLYETTRVTTISRAPLGLFVCVDGVLVDRPDFYTDHSIVVHGLRSNTTRCSPLNRATGIYAPQYLLGVVSFLRRHRFSVAARALVFYYTEINPLYPHLAQKITIFATEDSSSVTRIYCCFGKALLCHRIMTTRADFVLQRMESPNMGLKVVVIGDDRAFMRSINLVTVSV